MEEIVRAKLRLGILNYMLTTEQLRGDFKIKLFSFYKYANELLVFIVGIGIAGPFLQFTGLSSSTTQYDFKDPQIIAAVILAAIWVLFKYYVNDNDLSNLHSGRVKMSREFNAIEVELKNALALENPIDSLIEIQLKVGKIVQRNIPDGVYQPIQANDNELKKRIDNLVRESRANWMELTNDDLSTDQL